MPNIAALVTVAAVMFAVLGAITLIAHIYNLNNIKSKTVGDGQHGTARWANKAEIRKTYRHIPFTPKKWRKQAKQNQTPTMTAIAPRKLLRKKTEPTEEALPQGIVVGCKGGKHSTTAMIDTGDVHVLMIGAAGVGKTAFWLYPCIEYACASGMSFLSTDTKGDVMRNYGRKKWHHTTVNYVLNNERYKGDALLQKQITTQTLPFKKQRNHGEQPMYYVENSNPAIVSRETYEAVQALIKSRQPSCKRKAKTYPLTRMLLCPDCGHTFRRQVVNGTAYWLCAAKATNKTDCAWRRVKEDEVYAAFNLMIRKVQANREYLLGTLIRQLEELQYRTTGSQQRIKEIDREIADLTAQNLVLSRLHGKGVLNAADYTAQSDVLENKITELRIERRAKITDSDENEMLDELKMLNDILKEVEIGIDFDAELFEQTVDSITVDSNELLTFHLAGGISLPEKIREKGRCYQA